MSSSNASKIAPRDVDGFKSMAQDVAAAAQEKVGDAAQKVQQLGGDAVHAVQDRFEDLQGRASECFEQGRAKVREFEHTLENRVRAQPMTYLLVAGSLGFALGFLFAHGIRQ